MEWPGRRGGEREGRSSHVAEGRWCRNRKQDLRQQRPRPSGKPALCDCAIAAQPPHPIPPALTHEHHLVQPLLLPPRVQGVDKEALSLLAGAGTEGWTPWVTEWVGRWGGRAVRWRAGVAARPTRTLILPGAAGVQASMPLGMPQARAAQMASQRAAAAHPTARCPADRWHRGGRQRTAWTGVASRQAAAF